MDKDEAALLKRAILAMVVAATPLIQNAEPCPDKEGFSEIDDKYIHDFAGTIYALRERMRTSFPDQPSRDS